MFGSRTALSYFVDALWFRSLGYGAVFAKSVTWQWGVFATFAVVTFFVLYGTFGMLRRAHFADLPTGRTIMIGGQPLKLSIEPVLRILAVSVSLLIAGISGAAMMAEWPTLALFWYAPQASGSVIDPVFGRPLNFFLFTLPAWHLILNWLLMITVIPCILAALFLLLTGGVNAASNALDGRRMLYGSSPARWRGLSIGLAFLLLVIAMREYLARYALLLDVHTIFQGVTYTDAHVTITAMLVISLALVLGAAIAAVNAARNPNGRLLFLAIIPAVVCFFVFGLIGWYVSNFVVKPNELVREQPFITHRNDPAGLWTRQVPAARVSGGDDRWRDRSSKQSGHAQEYSSLGLACSAGYTSPDPGDSNLLRLSGHRHRSL
jgi:uncharacterized membrane protein (UPF0182 family)